MVSTGDRPVAPTNGNYPILPLIQILLLYRLGHLDLTWLDILPAVKMGTVIDALYCQTLADPVKISEKSELANPKTAFFVFDSSTIIPLQRENEYVFALLQ